MQEGGNSVLGVWVSVLAAFLKHLDKCQGWVQHRNRQFPWSLVLFWFCKFRGKGDSEFGGRTWEVMEWVRTTEGITRNWWIKLGSFKAPLAFLPIFLVRWEGKSSYLYSLMAVRVKFPCLPRWALLLLAASQQRTVKQAMVIHCFCECTMSHGDLVCNLFFS